MSVEEENKLVISRLTVEDKGRTVVSREVVATLPPESGTYQTLTGDEIMVAVRLGTTRRAERTIDVNFGDGQVRTVSIGRKTGTGVTLEPLGKTAIEVAVKDPSLLRAAPKPRLGLAPRMS